MRLCLIRLVSKNSGVGGCRKRRTSSVYHVLRDFKEEHKFLSFSTLG